MENLSVSYYKNEMIKSSIPYLNKKRHGVATWWYDNGQIECEASYVLGKCFGMHRRWYINGQLEFEIKNYNEEKVYLTLYWKTNGNFLYINSSIRNISNGIFVKFAYYK